MLPRTIVETRERVRQWDEAIAADSQMYSRLAQFVATNDAILDVIRRVQRGQLEMNMLLAAVQYLLLHDPTQPLAAWYPSLGGTRQDEQLEEAFRDFVLSHRDAILELITTRRVQTNEVARCVFLLPAYNLVESWAGRPLALAEIGTSAGLNQNVDRYGYAYQSSAGTMRLGERSAVQLHTDCGPTVPKSARRIPNIVWRTGVDLHPIDVTDVDDAMWLRALVWPDQVERHSRLAAAIEVAQSHPPKVAEGDAFVVLPDLVARAPQHCTLIVQHSFVLNQFSSAERERFYDLLDEQAQERPIYRVAAEWLTQIRATVLSITEHGPDRRTTELGQVHHHGAWMRLTEPDRGLP
ncbi:MAG: DUF2332 domain-containing protein [Acidimicrobiia bacterium]|nr:DUF2332 domain-containing protein [Acidimicrobiia bacterium]